MTRRAHLLLFASVLAFAIPLFSERIPNRYIVEFNTESVAQKLGRRLGREGARGTAATAQRTRIRAEQQQARQQLPADANVLDSVDTVANALFVEFPDARVAELKALPNVRAVYPVRTFHRMLDRAVQVNKVVDAWNQIGVDRAGAGVKIAILDTGIDANHAAFQDASLTIPSGFPKLNYAADSVWTNNKVIVARSYVALLSYRDWDYSSRDHVGHGTALASIAAGVQNAGPKATIQGVAPKAWLGNYKIFGSPGYNDSSSDTAIIKAIDDAVADGMDIINLSVGDDFAPRLADDMEVQAIEAASQAGVLVVVAAGNNGPDLNTLGSPATAPSAIAAGAMRNDRTFAASVDVAGLQTFVAVVGDGATPSSAISGEVVDVTTLDGNGLGCNAFTKNSLSGRIALIQRGTCTFEAKLGNAQTAGAVGAIVYAAATSPDPFTMSVGAATLPAEMISFSDGTAIQQALSAQGSVTATLNFTEGAVPTDATRMASYSAAGPSVNYAIKPELVAVGSDMYMATQSYDPYGDMYNADGYILAQGTSFSTPMIAGAAAVLKSARPGLSVDQYRSLLINNGTDLKDILGNPSTVQRSGGGAMNVWASLNAAITAVPATLGFGTTTDNPQVTQTLTITNISGADATFTLTVAPSTSDAGPALETNTLTLAAGESKPVAVTWTGSGLTGGGHEGFIQISGASTGVISRVPYWYDVADSVPVRISTLYNVGTARRNTRQNDAILIRILDGGGVPITSITPTVTVTSGGGSVSTINNYDSEVPGIFGITVRLGAAAGTNTYHIQAGDASLDVSISGQ